MAKIFLKNLLIYSLFLYTNFMEAETKNQQNQDIFFIYNKNDLDPMKPAIKGQMEETLKIGQEFGVNNIELNGNSQKIQNQITHSISSFKPKNKTINIVFLSGINNGPNAPKEENFERLKYVDDFLLFSYISGKKFTSEILPSFVKKAKEMGYEEIIFNFPFCGIYDRERQYGMGKKNYIGKLNEKELEKKLTIQESIINKLNQALKANNVENIKVSVYSCNATTCITKDPKEVDFTKKFNYNSIFTGINNCEHVENPVKGGSRSGALYDNEFSPTGTAARKYLEKVTNEEIKCKKYNENKPITLPEEVVPTIINTQKRMNPSERLNNNLDQKKY
jgi:hypothetical protein